MQLKWTGPIAVLLLSFLQPCRLSGLKFIPVYEALTIRTNKASPPYIAFDEIRKISQADNEWTAFEAVPTTQLAAGPARVSILKKEKLPRVVLKEMVISREQTMTVAAQPADQSWMNELSAPQQKLLEMAQARSDVLDQDWTPPTWSDEVKRVLNQSGASVSQAPSSGVIIKNPAAPDQPQSVPQATVSLASNQDTAGKVISGPIEMAGGLALTNEHYIEVRRSAEGIAQEAGRVDVRHGTYSISVREPSGLLTAKLVTREGRILGEGSIRLAHLDFNGATVSGPKLKIEPASGSSGSGIVASFYQPTSAPPKQTQVTMLKGARDFAIRKDGQIPLEKLAKGSSTVVRSAAPTFLQTSSVVVMGENFRSTLFPESMIRALREIVLGQKQDQTPSEELGNIVWGRVSMDGKPMAGMTVQVEGFSELQPVYFNQLMLPDAGMTATGENGLYALIGVPDGFHSLAARREQNLFGYQNVVVEKGTVSLGDIQNSLRSESIPLRVFDAFNGSPVAARVTLQSLDQEVDARTGSEALLLPQINRLGLLRAVPEGNDYLPARYLYNDKDAFVHVPMVSWSWLSNIKTYLRINEAPGTGIAVGFVHDENFEVYVAGAEQFAAENIVYFDMRGRILQSHEGVAGGGFIIYNLPAETQEIVVIGERSEKVYSRVFPVDPNALSVLSFRE